MNKHFLATAKAYAALVGALVVAALGVLTPDNVAFGVLTVASALLTAFVTFRVPNSGEATDPEVN